MKIKVMRIHRDAENRSAATRLNDTWYLTLPGGIEFQVEVAVPHRPHREFSFRLHAGTEGSETPLHANASIAGFGIYTATSLGRRIAHRLSGGEGRDLSARFEWPHVSCHAWTTSDRWEKGRFAAWRDGMWSLSPSDRLWGERMYAYEDQDRRGSTLVLPDGEYPVTLTLQRMTRYRTRRADPARHEFVDWIVDWEAPKGIPFRVEGGWKGDSVYGSTVTLPGRDFSARNWESQALNMLASWVFEERARQNYPAPEAGSAVLLPI